MRASTVTETGERDVRSPEQQAGLASIAEHCHRVLALARNFREALTAPNPIRRLDEVERVLGAGPVGVGTATAPLISVWGLLGESPDNPLRWPVARPSVHDQRHGPAGACCHAAKAVAAHGADVFPKPLGHAVIVAPPTPAMLSVESVDRVWHSVIELDFPVPGSEDAFAAVPAHLLPFRALHSQAWIAPRDLPGHGWTRAM